MIKLQKTSKHFGGGEIMEVKIMLYPDRNGEKTGQSSSNSSAKSFYYRAEKLTMLTKDWVNKELGSVR